jgi:hypothetical protein
MGRHSLHCTATHRNPSPNQGRQRTWGARCPHPCQSLLFQRPFLLVYVREKDFPHDQLIISLPPLPPRPPPPPLRPDWLGFPPFLLAAFAGKPRFALAWAVLLIFWFDSTAAFLFFFPPVATAVDDANFANLSLSFLEAYTVITSNHCIQYTYPPPPLPPPFAPD